jgi:hypothetical protein
MFTRLNRHVLREEDKGGGGGGGGNPPAPEMVPKAEYEKLQLDLKKFQTDSQKLAEQLTNTNKELLTLKKQQSESQGDFKSLYETEKAAREEWEQKHGKLKENLFFNEKYRAAQSAVVKAGMKTDALKILDSQTFEELQVETTSNGRFLVHGAETFAEKMKREYGFAFETPKAPNVNGGGGNPPPNNDQELTAAYIVELEKKDPAKYKEMLPKYLAQRKAKQEARSKA